MRREKVGFVFQTFNLVPYLSALENVQVPLFLAKMEEKAQKDRATALLERVGLADRLDHKPGELSVGQQQRVALARMLANDPAVILADEPTGNLDPETSQQIIGFLEEFNAEGRTIVMVTHDPRAAKRAKRTLRLQNGAITCQGAGEDGCWKPEERPQFTLARRPASASTPATNNSMARSISSGSRGAADLAADRLVGGLGPADGLQHVVGVPVRFAGRTVAHGDLRDRGHQALGVAAFDRQVQRARQPLGADGRSA